MLKPFLFSKNTNTIIQDHLNAITKIITITNIIYRLLHHFTYCKILLITKFYRILHHFTYCKIRDSNTIPYCAGEYMNHC